mmetsp:Transcript_21625/g.39542  ORF Transcript_21625/g.39542 Transcript_21625/m.39542 type:complete len:132 (-) Transcript_21625:25-420(-)
MLVVLIVSYLYVSIGLVLLLMFSFMFFARRQALSELPFIVIPNDERRVESLSNSLLEKLELHTVVVAIDDLECPICYGSMPVILTQNGSYALKLPGCGHEMHSECVRDWFQRKSSCPVCRGDVALSLRASN